MVDTVRSIHFRAASTVDPAWSPKLFHGPYDLKALSNSLMLDGASLPPGLSFDDHLLILFDQLSTINTLLCSLGPLTSSASSIRQMAASRTAKVAEVSKPSTSAPSNRDYNNIRNKLVQALCIWEDSFRASGQCNQTGTQTDFHAIFTLLYFAKLLLEAGPGIYIIPSLAGYVSEPLESLPPTVPRPYAPHAIGFRISDKVVQYAVGILESAERRQSLLTTSGGISRSAELAPVWYPIALLYGALAIWSRREYDREGGPHSNILIPADRLLQSFHVALKMVESTWDCAGHMASIIEQLMD
ncbi:hypothetical protein LTS07_007782 [Exophiala sideris]|uniref:Transcription factor domain-containing protein n=1 Tax=Exophiala sideris TaxID=1016849 RepID=A0ABR0JAB7_9EURO|nr:hypothetical protein LTS07_007782 [Exophiala sideris]KAK5032510.1 hypothetical protein LTR13_007333 [Exophiala sideris]KAK5059669.1 hypothetical protein LTR69_006258 [Exophiala sideris]KAK5178048.1 hypothetical protein LTR44_009354 [Eurotiomycetes sp. CCFEE 6388]